MSEEQQLKFEEFDDLQRDLRAAKPRAVSGLDRDRLMFLAGQASVSSGQRVSCASQSAVRRWQLAAVIALLWAVIASSAMWRTGQRLQSLQLAIQDGTQRKSDTAMSMPGSRQLQVHAVVGAAPSTAPPSDRHSAFSLRQIAITNQWEALERSERPGAAAPPITYWNSSRRLVQFAGSPIRSSLGL
jgi:hypothetical protein